jgi:hypothetical protein
MDFPDETHDVAEALCHSLTKSEINLRLIIGFAGLTLRLPIAGEIIMTHGLIHVVSESSSCPESAAGSHSSSYLS